MNNIPAYHAEKGSKSIHIYKETPPLPNLCPVRLSNLLDVLGARALLAKHARGDARRRGGCDAAVEVVPLQDGHAQGAVLRGDEQLAARVRHAHHARQQAARRELIGEAQGAGVRVELEVGDAVRRLARQAVRHVDVVGAGQHELTGSGLGGVLGGCGRVEGGDGAGEGEVDTGGLAVGEGVDNDLVLDLAHDQVVSSLTDGRVESTVTGTTTSGLNAHAVDNVKGVVLGVNQKDLISAEVIDGEEAAARVVDGLVRMGSSLTLSVGAKLAIRSDSLEQLKLAALDVPDVDGAVAVRSAQHTGALGVKLEVHNTSTRVPLHGKLQRVRLEIQVEQPSSSTPFINSVEQVRLSKRHPARVAGDLLVDAVGEARGAQVRDHDTASGRHEHTGIRSSGGRGRAGDGGIGGSAAAAADDGSGQGGSAGRNVNRESHFGESVKFSKEE